MEVPARSDRPHLIVINSEPEFLRVVAQLLEEEGYSVSTMKIDQSPYARILAERPDAIVLDIVHGMRHSWDLLDVLDGDPLTRNISLLVTSTDPELIERALARSTHRRAYGMILKPAELDEFVAAVQYVAPSTLPL